MKLLFLDTETTGNKPEEDRLISVAYKVDGKMTHELFRPTKPIAIDAMATHHITEEMVEGKEAFQGSEIYKELEALLQDHILVAHNAMFDIAMLEAEGLTVPQFICTLKVARALDMEGEIPRHSLQYLRYYWKLPVGNGEEAIAHSADGDVLVLEALYNHLEKQMEEKYDGKKDGILQAMMEISVLPSIIHTLHFGKYRGEKIVDLARRDPGYLEWLLGQKEEAQATGTGGHNDEDFIYTLRKALGRS